MLQANETERRGVMDLCSEYIKGGGRDGTPVLQISAGCEPPNFTCHFLGWDHNKVCLCTCARLEPPFEVSRQQGCKMHVRLAVCMSWRPQGLAAIRARGYRATVPPHAANDARCRGLALCSCPRPPRPAPVPACSWTNVCMPASDPTSLLRPETRAVASLLLLAGCCLLSCNLLSLSCRMHLYGYGGRGG